MKTGKINYYANNDLTEISRVLYSKLDSLSKKKV